MVSFHATKILHTFEGGLIYFKDPEQKARQRAWSNFGFDAEGNPEKVGFNSKITEINALMGSLLLENVDDQIRFRSELVKLYRERLSGVAGIDPIQFSPQLRQNHQYFPVIVRKYNSPNVRDELWQFLQTKNIFSRRYFYPLCSNIPEYQADAAQFPIANAATQSILCLPLSGQLSSQQVNYICEQIISFMKK
jgi:dTDP-4-amino-4,6-dideoxygalactose transaminase